VAKNIITGIDIGSSMIKVMVAEKEKGSSIPRVLGVGESETIGMRKGCVVNTEDVSQSIISAVKGAEKMAGIPIKHAFVSFGGSGLGSLRGRGVVVVSRADSEITSNDASRAVDVSREQVVSVPNREIIHFHPISYLIDDSLSSVNPVGMRGARLEVETLFTTGIQQDIRNLVKSVEGAGISVDDIIATPFASASAVLNKKQKEAGVVLLDIGTSTTSLIVFEEGSPLSIEVFPVGSEHITKDIAIGLKISLDEAENIKYDFTSNGARKNKVAEIVEARLFDIFELADKHLRKIGRNRLLPAGVVITGGGANLYDIVEFAKKGMQLPAEVGIPSAIESNYSRLQDPRWSAATGLCIAGFDDEIGDFGGDIIKRANNTLIRWFRAFLP